MNLPGANRMEKESNAGQATLSNAKHFGRVTGAVTTIVIAAWDEDPPVIAIGGDCPDRDTLVFLLEYARKRLDEDATVVVLKPGSVKS